MRSKQVPARIICGRVHISQLCILWHPFPKSIGCTHAERLSTTPQPNVSIASVVGTMFNHKYPRLVPSHSSPLMSFAIISVRQVHRIKTPEIFLDRQRMCGPKKAYKTVSVHPWSQSKTHLGRKPNTNRNTRYRLLPHQHEALHSAHASRPPLYHSHCNRSAQHRAARASGH